MGYAAGKLADEFHFLDLQQERLNPGFRLLGQFPGNDIPDKIGHITHPLHIVIVVWRTFVTYKKYCNNPTGFDDRHNKAVVQDRMAGRNVRGSQPFAFIENDGTPGLYGLVHEGHDIEGMMHPMLAHHLHMITNSAGPDSLRQSTVIRGHDMDEPEGALGQLFSLVECALQKLLGRRSLCMLEQIEAEVGKRLKPLALGKIVQKPNRAFDTVVMVPLKLHLHIAHRAVFFAHPELVHPYCRGAGNHIGKHGIRLFERVALHEPEERLTLALCKNVSGHLFEGWGHIDDSTPIVGDENRSFTLFENGAEPLLAHHQRMSGSFQAGYVETGTDNEVLPVPFIMASSNKKPPVSRPPLEKNPEFHGLFCMMYKDVAHSLSRKFTIIRMNEIDEADGFHLGITPAGDTITKPGAPPGDVPLRIYHVH
jgi:hypothetical protein